MKKSLSLSLFVVGACYFVAEALPTENNGRFKRQATTDVNPSSSSSTDGSTPLATQSTPTSTSSAAPSSSSEPSQNNNDFGLGAVAGFGGLTRGVGIGNFQLPTATASKNDPLSPWGAFAGLNLGNGGRIGAGCQGLSCGVQLGHFVLGTPQLLGLGRNILNPQQRRDDEKLRPDGPSNESDGSAISEHEGNGGSDFLKNVQSFTDEQLAKLREREEQVRGQTQESLANFARLGGQFLGNGGGGDGGDKAPEPGQSGDQTKKEIFPGNRSEQ